MGLVKQKSVPLFLVSLLALLLSILTTVVHAHPPGLSSVDMRLKGDSVDITVTFATQDIEAFVPMDADLDADVTVAELEAAKPRIAQLIIDQFHVAMDGKDAVAEQPGRVSFDDQNNAHVEFSYLIMPLRQVVLQSGFLSLLPDGHQHVVTVKNVDGKVIVEKMLNRQDNRLSFSVGGNNAGESNSATSAVAAFVSFFELGVEHIVTGYDHLLFLFALLAVTHSFWPAIKIITFFTIAHSLTLALAGLNLVELPSSLVEPFIAVTIIYVAVENLVRGDHPKGRHWLTFGFGLIHGFGFASILQEMNIGSGGFGILLPLLSFNLGIETGQVAVASIVLPMIWWLNNKATIAGKFLKSCSVMIALMGVYWLVERTML